MSAGSRRNLDDARRLPSVRTLLTVLVTLVVIGVVVGLIAMASLASSTTRTAANRIDVSGESQLVIRSTDADVRLIEGTSSDVVIRARVTSGIRETAYELRRRGDEIEVVGSCMRWISPGCGVVATVAVPAKLPVLVATDSADVVADGLRERVVTIATGSGDVRGRALSVLELDTRSHDGDVSAQFKDQPFAFKARTSSGDVSARIPSGEIDYTVSVKSRTGDVASDFESVPKAKGIIQVVSDSGDIRLRR
jgi:hypothetical protein